MIRDVLGWLDYSRCAEISLALFLGVFVAVSLRALLMTRQSSDADDKLLDHLYDGIQEYDNPLPGWWTGILWVTVVFSICYWLYYACGDAGVGIHDDYQADLAANLRLQFAELGELKSDRDTIVKYMNDPNWLKVGQIVFKSNCISCHGLEGQGTVGPNLCDDAWKNVDRIEDVATVIGNGAAGGAMPSWKNRLHPNELVLAASYVASLRGSNPSNPKPPEGKVIPPWPAAK